MSNVTLVLGTGRSGRVSESLAKVLEMRLKERGVDPQFVDVRDHVTTPFTIPPWDPQGAKNVPSVWQKIVAETDTFVFVIPEYNSSFPGEWKLLMDKLYKEYAGKRAYVATVSDGQFGGVRVMEHILPVLVRFQLSIAPERLHLAHADTAFDGAGSVTEETVAKRIEGFVDAIVTHSNRS